MEAELKMIAAATKALEFLRRNSNSTDSEVLQYVVDYIFSENIRDYSIKFCMIASATETYKIFVENPKLSDKEIFSRVVLKIPEIQKRF